MKVGLVKTCDILP